MLQLRIISILLIFVVFEWLEVNFIYSVNIYMRATGFQNIYCSVLPPIMKNSSLLLLTLLQKLRKILPVCTKLAYE